VGNDNSQGEYYLPDVLALAVAEGREVASCTVESEMEVLGINDRLQQQLVEREYQRRQAQDLLQSGVAIADSGRIDIRGHLSCGDDVSIDVNAVFEGRVVLGNGVRIGPNCVIKNSRIDDGAEIHAFSSLEDAIVGDGCSVGPYARLRPGTELGEGARIGNFVETKKARIGRGSKANHLAYIGDCEMGDGVNVGAGTITCNYDGVNKHTTRIGNDVFVGSNSTLVAPLEIADEGFVAAGSTITKTVGEKELGVSRARQRNVQGWRRPQRDED
jgi:bifunctional UDP-N-acetylglucosamine pyrophosphorylase/glucosamine-1-phosphate N-acetyltransferase